LAGCRVTRRRRTADSGVGEIWSRYDGTRDPDDADGDLTDTDGPQSAETAVAGQTAVDAEQRQREDACELADVTHNVRYLARHLTKYAAERPTVTE